MFVMQNNVKSLSLIENDSMWLYAEYESVVNIIEYRIGQCE